MIEAMSNRSIFTVIVAFIASILTSPIVSAQVIENNSSRLVIDEVIVTAQKREQNMQDIPVSVTAISSDSLQSMGIGATHELTRLSASLNFTGADNKQNTGFRIRGIGSTAFAIGVEPTVAVIIDDVSQVQSGQALSKLVDIERIEVLRGPQSTLFGKNASGGAVNVVTKAPADEFEGFIEASYTDENEVRVSGSISGPVTDSLRYRVTGLYSDYDGLVRNEANGNILDASQTHAIRARLTWNPSDTIEVNLTGYYSEDDESCCAPPFRQVSPGSGVFPPFLLLPLTNPLTFDSASTTNDVVELDVEPLSTTKDRGGSLKIAWDVGEHTLTSITAYNKWDFSRQMDGDLSAFDILGGFGGSGGVEEESIVDVEYISQEFRVNSPASDILEYVAGLFYSDSTSEKDYFFGPFFGSDYVSTAGTETLAIFGQGTWKPLEQLHITLGLRYNDEEISADFVDAGGRIQANDSENEVLVKAAVQYFLNENTMLFGNYARGYKGQVYDLTAQFDQSRADNPIGSETSDAFEVGVKTELFDNRLQLNLVAFFSKYDNFQSQNFVANPVTNVIEARLDNVGKLETNGVELDAKALISENLLMTVSAAYIDATIEEYPNADCYPIQSVAEGCTETASGSGIFSQDLAGKDLPNTPELKITLAVEYTLPLNTMPFDGFMNLNYFWQDDVNYDVTQNPRTGHDSYGIANLNVGIAERDDGRYRLTLFVNNLFDEHYVSGIFDASGFFGGVPTMVHFVPRDAERYGGVRFKYSF